MLISEKKRGPPVYSYAAQDLSGGRCELRGAIDSVMYSLITSMAYVVMWLELLWGGGAGRGDVKCRSNSGGRG